MIRDIIDILTFIDYAALWQLLPFLFSVAFDHHIQLLGTHHLLLLMTIAALYSFFVYFRFCLRVIPSVHGEPR